MEECPTIGQTDKKNRRKSWNSPGAQRGTEVRHWAVNGRHFGGEHHGCDELGRIRAERRDDERKVERRDVPERAELRNNLKQSEKKNIKDYLMDLDARRRTSTIGSEKTETSAVPNIMWSNAPISAAPNIN